MSEALQTLDQVSFQTLWMESVEVIAAQIGVSTAFPLQMISNHQDAVGNGHVGALPAATSGKLFKLS